MDKIIKKTITSDDYEKALVGTYYEPYTVSSITWIIGTNKYKIELKLQDTVDNNVI